MDKRVVVVVVVVEEELELDNDLMMIESEHHWLL